MNKIRSVFPGPVCRRCINDYFQVDLKSKDCKYELPYVAECSCCGYARNIVTGLKLSGKIKMMNK